jgi:hypothetical protein
MRTHKALLALIDPVVAALALGITLAGAGTGPSDVERARGLVEEFFQTINARQYERVCDLLSAEFYRVNRVPDEKHCVLGFSLGMSGGAYRFEVTGVRTEGRLMVVSALANGAPGDVLPVEEAGQLKVLELRAT